MSQVLLCQVSSQGVLGMELCLKVNELKFTLSKLMIKFMEWLERDRVVWWAGINGIGFRWSSW